MAGWSGANNTKVKIPGPREVTRWGQSIQDQALNSSALIYFLAAVVNEKGEENYAG